jgi:hypothetical protein
MMRNQSTNETARQPPTSSLALQGSIWPSICCSVAAFAVLLATLGDYAIVWDEGQYLTQEAKMRQWFARLLNPGAPDSGVEVFSRASVLKCWDFSREQPNGHPPFWAIVSNAGWLVSHQWLDPLSAHRVGSAAIFAIALGAMFRMVQRHWGVAAAVTAAASLIFMPRVFVHAHLNTTDATLTALWILSVVVFDRARASWPGAVESANDPIRRHIHAGWLWSALFGVFLGWVAVTKLTGWFVPVPLVVWAMLRRDWSAWKSLVAAGPVCIATMFLFNPPWWHDPIDGVALFLRENLGRRTNTLITTLFFGRIYAYELPWYNALVWTGVTVPAGILLLSLAGLVRSIAGLFRDSLASLVLLNWLTVIVVRSLPNVPGHDGERQLMASFPFLACLAGFGAAGTYNLLARILSDRSHASRILAGGIIATVLGTALAGLVRYHPVQLSYYNEFIGGLSGAERAGLEPTYFWDALTDDMLEWLNTHSAPDDAVLFCAVPESFSYLRRWNQLRVRLLPHELGVPRWYVLQNRPGLFRPADRWLIEHARPSHARTQGGVPLLWIFTLEQYEHAIRETRREAPRGTSDE